MSFKNRAIALLVAQITLTCGDYIFAQEHYAKIKLTRKFHELRYAERCTGVFQFFDHYKGHTQLDHMEVTAVYNH